MINGISNQIAIAKTGASTSTGQTTEQFSTFLKDSVNELNNTQRASDIATEKLAKGENVELQDVMITAQKASITMQTALEIRNKAVEAYQEMMRMQM
ncbi:flagellar hook-basal body complex protein FliE [Priestia megaterium]|uniref:flagellar hook-basal body complex protein FliE n=1 Tax=Priestia megaterium TaxID=1404 RepID=UPI0013E2951C|nr:flagellar hook-basal body complex protein FliE [Priestia megaterium]MED3862692.1 flagellar hook-basal body complex protein FliE [Priestia megaterium]MED4099779.1 flagellar hook-basal body complex protein FliE [Priestia megaterium]MED4143350.1 flagellar hook-basal body complex protein FliE [Priestia megaterium]MED4167099.1 flagellar hook-basal body complex protein FliE [Priestia megaterium]MED4197396.1 flagellar hook-basal body complex protein FliE [Priestia megaterium]